MSIGINAETGVKTTAPKKKKELVFKEPTVDNIKENLLEQIQIVQSKSLNYKTVSLLASEFLMTHNKFREVCMNSSELSNLFTIYNNTILEDMMVRTIKTGKVNNNTEKYLKDEMQAFSNTGTEQVVNWLMQTNDDIKVYKHNQESGEFDLEVEVVPDVQKKTTEQYETIFDNMENE